MIVASVASALAIFWHTDAMSGGGMDDGGMSPVCLTVCLTHGDVGIPAAGFLPAVAVGAAFFVFLCEIFIGPVGPLGPDGQAKKDRHRYLMKTIVMLR